MKLALPKFQFRFVPAFGNVIHPGNFHPVGTQRAAQAMVEQVETGGKPLSVSGQSWLVVGGSGGFGSAARAVLGAGRGANTLNVSFDAQPNPESNNKVRKIGSPGFHRNLAIERSLRALGTTARSLNGDAFDPELRESAIETIREHFGGKIDGLVWSLAAPRALDPRTGAAVSSALKPLGRSVTVKTFTGRDERSAKGPEVAQIDLPPGTPEEAIRTIYVMGGGIVSRWVEAMLAADVLADGFRLLTISYRGNPLNEGVYRKGLIGLAKADLEFETKALDHVLQQRVGGNAYCVEGPAVVTEASGGIPGVPFYMAHLLDVMGDRFEDPLASMQRMFEQHFGASGPSLDEEGLLRMDDRELAADVQQPLAERFDAAKPGDPFPEPLYDRFMSAYARTRGFEVPGVDYEAEFDTDGICR
jgi:enoyl-[acyl-carrier protein] reductase / trans-2-enoyl-CoA reductase (NAD+)